VQADVTVAFGTYKVAHLVQPAAGACGVVHLVDLGLKLPRSDVVAWQQDDVASVLPRLAARGHKYSRGVVGVRTGSSEYQGAAVLSVAGAGCGVAGMVRYDGSVADGVRIAHPEVVIGNGKVQAWVVGSGSGHAAGLLLDATLPDGVPVVVDADALGPFVTRDRRSEHAGSLVLTPHAGELASMLGVKRAEVEAHGLRFVRAAAERFGAVVLLKGNHTLIAAPGGPVAVNTTGTPWLGTAGSGDVLAGLIGALLAAGLAPYAAAVAGAWLHGAAGNLASRGGPVTAGGIAAALPDAVRRVLGSG
ncbi:MAG: NAD(P)H-hydrate dehydratase, partial [Nocardioides sp.]